MSIIRTESDMTEARTKFIKTLTFIQNRGENATRDILTITGFMDDREVSRHVIREAGRLPKGKQGDIVRYLLSLREAA